MLSIVDRARRHATLRMNDVAYTFLADGDSKEESITFGELDAKASQISALLANFGPSTGPVLLLYPPGLEFIVSFLGCLYAGRPPVPVSIPRRSQSINKLRKIKENSGARLLLTDSSEFCNISARVAEDKGFEDVKILNTESLDLSRLLGLEKISPNSSLAFLQYTSGSTGDPKGVMVSHENIVVNQTMIQEAFGHGDDTLVLGWLPFHHDMGLIGNIMQPLFIGCSAILMSPVAFAQKPVRWLRAISKYAATTSGGPNFAYDLCVRRCLDFELEGIDLGSWKVAFNGAEPVRATTLKAFAERFTPYGFSSKAFLPCYGMAEATLFITGAKPGTGFSDVAFDDAALTDWNEAKEALNKENARLLVGCGAGRQGIDVRIVDPNSLLECDEGHVGEVWIAGANVAGGYWQNIEATRSTFHAFLNHSGQGPFLRTGDLGFLRGGELYVTGRLKEILIIRGRNFYPHDIETTVAAAHPSLHGCEGAAFPIDVDGEERLVVVHEVARTHLRCIDIDAVLMSVREQVAKNYELMLKDLVLVRPASIPKTSSGKTQRRRCAEMYKTGAWDAQRLINRAKDSSLPESQKSA